jgi:flagellar biosynthetic protein FliO
VTTFLVAIDPVITGPELVPPVWKAAAALALVLAMLVGLGWMLRRSQVLGGKRKPMSIESALSLGERRSLAIVTVEGRRLLLGLAPNHVSLVTELTKPAAFEEAVSHAMQTPSSGGAQ